MFVFVSVPEVTTDLIAIPAGMLAVSVLHCHVTPSASHAHVVVIDDGGAAIVTVNIFEAVITGELESVTVSVTVNVPDAVGVPLIVAPDWVNPGGRPLPPHV